MKSRSSGRVVAAALGLAALLAGPGLGCSADEGAQPDPEITTPGAIVGAERPEGGVRLLKVLQAYRFDDNLTLIVTTYRPIAADFAEARRLARRADLPVQEPSVLIGENDLGDYEILWWRSLTPEERDGSP